MLCHALTQMIDEAECFIFLKSSNSISIKNSVEGTFSPWIFHELATVETIRENKSRDSIPDDISECDIKPLMENADCDKKVFYPISLKKSFALTSMDLENWSQSLNSGKIQNDFFSTSEQEYLKQAAQYCENVGNGSAAANEKWEKSLNWLYKNCNNKVFDYDKTSSIL